MYSKGGPKRKIELDLGKESSENDLDDDDDEENGITYYEESSESEPELECEVWDVDCKIVPKQILNVITGYHLMPTCTKDPDLHPKKKQKIVPEINVNLVNNDTIKGFQDCWNKNQHVWNKNFELIVDPFKVCVIHNFFQNEYLLNEIIQEFYELDWNTRSMDLYEFFQSKDLKYLKSEHMRNLYNFLKDDIRKWVSNLTGFDLTHISATCSLYSNTDYLLVHDDQRDDRMVAFVLYLTGKSGWSKRKGGEIQLLSKNREGQPLEVVRSIFPTNNQFLFFPVTNDSYHQVAEVTTLNDCRLSINGWFHTKTIPMFETIPFIPLDNGLYSNTTVKPKEVDIDLDCWINEDYLTINSIKLIQHHIEENSEISLKNYFKEECFNEILQTLQNNDMQWIKVGPPNRYCYEVVNTDKLPHSIERFLSLFQSKEMFMLLQKYTDLELTSPSASLKFELQRWTPGCYSLLTDYDWQEKNELDLLIHFGCKESTDVIGARTQYVTIEDEIQNALITLEPEENNLNIVYRDSARFTKYFSKQSKCQCFYTLVCSYSE